MSAYADGFVVVAREWQRIRTNSRLPTRAGWTLHRHDCHYVTKARAQPAPTRAYPDTVPCTLCRPDSDPHRFVYIEHADTTVTGFCRDCGITVTAGSRKSASGRLWHRHRQAAASIELTQAQATGPVDTLIGPRNRGGWTVHQATCARALSKARGLRPVPAQLPPGTIDCQACRPGIAAPLEMTAWVTHRRRRSHRDDGAVRVVCACGVDTGFRPNGNAARAAFNRAHKFVDRRDARSKQANGTTKRKGNSR